MSKKTSKKTEEAANETIEQAPDSETVIQQPDPNATVTSSDATGEETALFGSQQDDSNATVIGKAEVTDANATVIGAADESNATVIGQTDPNQTVVGGESTGTETVDFAPDAASTATHIPSAGASEGGFSLNDPSRAGTMIHGTQLREIASRGAGDSGAIGGMIGDYRVEAELGRGGMGVVYKATHSKLKREVAIKMILHGKHTGPDAIARFLTEARAVANLQHPNIVQIFDIGEHEDLPYFSLEFVPGTDLQKKIAKQPQPAKEAAAMVEKLARAMQYAHSENILHRDLKPANVLISDAGVPKVTDFGLAKELDESDSEGTQAGTIMGSPSYMSPEQAGGRTNEIGPPTDQYSLGAILYEMLTGRPPFLAAKPLDTVMQVVNNEPVAPRELQPDVPVDLETICLKTLQKDQAQRYENCEELANDLKRYLNGEPISARPVGAPERFWRWCKRNPKIAIPSAAAIAMLIAATGISTYSYSKVSAQNEIIEAKNADIQEKKDLADRKTAEALEAKGLAEEKEEVAEQRADLAITTIQEVITTVDEALTDDTEQLKTRITVLKAISGLIDKTCDEQLRNDPSSQMIPTINSLRFKLVSLWGKIGEFALAEAEVEKILDVARKRLEYKGQTDAARDNIARVLLFKLQIMRARGAGHEEMNETREEARAMAKQIMDEPQTKPFEEGDPFMFDVKESYANTTQAIGVDYMGRDNEIAAQYFDEALAVREANLAGLNEDPQFKSFSDEKKNATRRSMRKALTFSFLAQGAIASRNGDAAAAAAQYKRVLELRKEDMESYPDDRAAALQYADASRNYSENLMWSGNHSPALEAALDALPIYRQAAQASKDDFKKQEKVGDLLYQLAVLYELAGDDGMSRAELKESLTMRRQLAQDPKNKLAQTDYMIALGRAGEFDECLKVAELLADDADPKRLFYQARALAQLTRHNTDEKSFEVSKAVDALLKAIEGGYKDVSRMKGEPDLLPILEEPRVKEAFAAIE